MTKREAAVLRAAHALSKVEDTYYIATGECGAKGGPWNKRLNTLLNAVAKLKGKP